MTSSTTCNRFETWGDEKVFGSWPGKCKKRTGVILFTAHHLVHIPDEGGAELAIIVTLDDVDTYSFSKKKQDIDQSKFQPSCVQLVMRSGVKFIMELISPERKWVHMSELKDLCDKRSSLKAFEEREAQAQQVKEECERLEPQLPVVFGDRALREQYSYLVVQTKAMSQREFLSAHSHDISVQTPLPLQPGEIDLTARSIGVEGDSNKKLDGVISEGEADAMFREFPALKQLYHAQVPAVLKADQFWKRCLRSRYYLEATGREVPPGHRTDPLFDALERPCLHERPPPSSVVADTDLSVDLTGEFARPREEFVPKRNSSSKLLDFLNERSSAALAEALGSSSGGKQPFSSSSASGRNISTDALGGPALGHLGKSLHGAETPSGHVDNTKSDPVNASAELIQSVERRRNALKRHAEDLKAELGRCVEPQTKVVRYQLQDHPQCGKTAPIDAKARRVPNAYAPQQHGFRDSLQKWSAASSHLKRPTTSAVRTVLQKATDDLITTDRIAASVVMHKQQASRKLPLEAAEAATRAQTLLSHFWSSRLDERQLRSRLAKQLETIMQVLKKWEARLRDGPATTPGTGGGLSDEHLARGSVSQTFLPPVQRALHILHTGSNDLET